MGAIVPSTSGGVQLVPRIPVSGPSVLLLSLLRHPLLVVPRSLLPCMLTRTGLRPRPTTHRMIPKGLRPLLRLPAVAVVAVRLLRLTTTPLLTGQTSVMVSSR